MSISARLSRVEQRIVPTDPFADMTDDELEYALAKVRQAIEERAGMSEAELAANCETALASGTPCELDGQTLSAEEMRAFVRAFKMDYALEKQLGRPLMRTVQ